MNRCSNVLHDPVFEDGDLEDVVLFKNFPGDPQHSGIKAHGGNAASAAVSPVVHLPGRFEDVLSPHRDAAGKSGHPASAFRLCLKAVAGDDRSSTRGVLDC